MPIRTFIRDVWTQARLRIRTRVGELCALPGQLIRGSDESPDFEQSVKVVLATFTVFTGFTINFFVMGVTVTDLSKWQWWAFFALVALMLRYIFGSAIHLNGTYVGKTINKPIPDPPAALTAWSQEKAPPKSRSIALLCKDFLFLVLFGMLAVHITDAKTVESFARRSMWFVGAGFGWSITDYFARRCWYRLWGQTPRDSWELRAVDLVFLVIFAWLACRAYQAAYDFLYSGTDIEVFIRRSAAIVFVGFFFSAINGIVAPDAPAAAVAPAQALADSEWPGPFWRLWVFFDGVQFLLTWWIVRSVDATAMGRVLAVTFIVFLFLDFGVMVRAVQLKWK